MVCLANEGRGGKEGGNRESRGGKMGWLCEGGKGWLAYYVTICKNRSVVVYSERTYSGL